MSVLIIPFAQDISWLSMDGVCHTIQNLVTAQPDNDSDVPLELVNVVHPRPVSWHEAMMHISTAVCSQTGTPLSLVPFEEWIAKVEDAARSAVRGQLEDVVRAQVIKGYIRLTTFFLHVARRQAPSFPQSP